MNFFWCKFIARKWPEICFNFNSWLRQKYQLDNLARYFTMSKQSCVSRPLFSLFSRPFYWFFKSPAITDIFFHFKSSLWFIFLLLIFFSQERISYWHLYFSCNFEILDKRGNLRQIMINNLDFINNKWTCPWNKSCMAVVQCCWYLWYQHYK